MITPQLKLGLQDYTPFEIGLLRLQNTPFQGPRAVTGIIVCVKNKNLHSYHESTGTKKINLFSQSFFQFLETQFIDDSILVPVQFMQAAWRV